MAKTKIAFCSSSQTSLVKPVYAGEARGYTEQQKVTFAMMNAIASRAVEEGVQVLRPL